MARVDDGFAQCLEVCAPEFDRDLRGPLVPDAFDVEYIVSGQ